MVVNQPLLDKRVKQGPFWSFSSSSAPSEAKLARYNAIGPLKGLKVGFSWLTGAWVMLSHLFFLPRSQRGLRTSFRHWWPHAAPHELWTWEINFRRSSATTELPFTSPVYPTLPATLTSARLQDSRLYHRRSHQFVEKRKERVQNNNNHLSTRRQTTMLAHFNVRREEKCEGGRKKSQRMIYLACALLLSSPCDRCCCCCCGCCKTCNWRVVCLDFAPAD